MIEKKINPTNPTQDFFIVPVVLPTPLHGRLPEVLHYRHSMALPPGTLVRVPLGARVLLGVVWLHDAAPEDLGVDVSDLKPIGTVLDVPPLPTTWVALIRFAAHYYQRFAGELAMAALPPQLRQLSDVQLARALKKHLKPSASSQPTAAMTSFAHAVVSTPVPLPAPVPASEWQASPQQEAVLAALRAGDPRPKLLFGATGSGKTEVYLRRIEEVLALDTQAQALVMVPEINLTPQMQARFQLRLEAQLGAGRVVLLHSSMTPAQRLASWLAAHTGQARVVLGTRLSVLASMPYLRLIVVDEEHDPSYKSQDGARYSARDLAVYRGHAQGAQVILGSATPSIESWHHTQSEQGAQGEHGNAAQARYQRLEMPARIEAGAMPRVVVLDMRTQSKLPASGLAPQVLEAISQRAARGEQSLVFLNRRGYAPVLYCASCDWKSACPHCSAYQVFHKRERRLRCHHCALVSSVPRQCPQCGDFDVGMQGRGTEQLEEALLAQLGEQFRVLRLDADSTRGKGTLDAQMASIHAGAVDVLVGTQMVTKGHDFRRVTLVVAVNPDSALFAADFRAPERLFALLMQAAGRAGRDARMSTQAEMWLQTHHPTHPLYRALVAHDYPAFAAMQLAERKNAWMPPFSYQALLRTEGRTQEQVQAFLDAAAAVVQTEAVFAPWCDPQSPHAVTLYPAIPMPVQRIANVERAQMLVESKSRVALQRLLTLWQPYLRDLKVSGVLRWALDVDPLSI